MEKWLLRHTDVALSLGGRLDDVIHSGAPQAKIIRSGNGVAEDWLCDSIQSHIGLMRFIFVGRHTRCKGLHVLYDALRGVQEQFELHLVGDIADRDRLDDARLTYHGQVTDEHRLKTLMRQMDVLLCPSLLEGAPTVVLEGMASGLAIVATDVGATCDLTGSDNGWLIPPNSVEALRNALGEALRLDPSLLEAKKRASLERVKSHLWPRVAEDTLRNIKDFLRQTAVG
ncbi:MAG: glycosyltransferase family 4 protein [Verrucomicrobia bacterium]|nr:glycosyltransferase family 4 protein [Verrucomicrobiota bacterium]